MIAFFRTSLFVYLSFIVLSFCIFGNTLKGDFIYDDTLVLTAPNLHSLSEIPKLLFSSYHYQFPESGLYRPITLISFALNFIVFGNSPVSFHVVNILLHGILCALIFHLIIEINRDRNFAWIVSGLFLVLPIHTEAVSSIVGRTELLWSLFCILALLYRKNIWISVSMFFLALLSKETAIACIPLLPLFYFHQDRMDWRKIVRKIIPYFVVLGLYFVLRYITLDNYMLSNNADIVYNPLKFLPWGSGFLTACKVLILYIQKIFFPYNLSSDYSFHQIKEVANIVNPFAIGGTAVLSILLFCLFCRNKQIAIASALFLFPHFIISNLLYKTGTIMADRLMYLPSFGLIFLIVYLLWKLTRRSYIVFLLCCIGLLYGSATYARNRVWLTQESLSRDAYAKSPDSIVTQLGMAQVFVAQGNTGSARELLLRANATYDKNVEILNLLGVIAWQSKDYPAAEEYFVKVLALRPRYNDALINLSRVYFQQNKIVDTRRILDQMYSYYPDAMGFQNLRLYLYILIQMRAYDDAIRIASAQGNNPEFDFLKGYAYLKKGDRAQAKPLLIDLPNPQSIQNHFNQIAKDFR